MRLKLIYPLMFAPLLFGCVQEMGSTAKAPSLSSQSQYVAAVELDADSSGGVDVTKGGTNVTTLTDGGVMLGSGTGSVTVMPVLADGEFIVGDGTTDPVAESGATARASLGLVIGTDVLAPDGDGASLTNVVKTSGAETIADVKTFSSFPVLPSADPTTNYQAATKKYVDDNAGGGGDVLKTGTINAGEIAMWSDDTTLEAKTGAEFKALAGVALDNVENTAVSTWGGSANIDTLGTITTGAWTGDPIGGAYVDIAGTTLETSIASNDEILFYDTSAAENRSMSRDNFIAGIGAGQAIKLDLEDNDVNETEDLGEIAVSGTDTNSIFTYPGTDKLLINVDADWPQADLADTVTVSDDENANDNQEVIFTTDNATLESDGDFYYNPSTGVATAPGFAGALTGNVTGNVSGTAATVTGAAQANITSLGTLTTLTVDNLTVNGNTITADAGAVNITPAAGSAIVLDGTISIDLGVVTGATSITSDAFFGALTGNASTATNATTAAVGTTVTISDNEATDEENEIPFIANAATPGDNALESSSDFTFNPSTGSLTVAGDIKYSGSITYEGSGESFIGLSVNAAGRSPSAGGYEMYYETDGSDVLSYSVNGSEKRFANLGDAQTFSGAKTFSHDIIMSEVADMQETPGAGYGYLWVKSDTPASLIFTDDAGTDYDLTSASSGDIESVGDAVSGAALDGSSDGGTYIRLYDGDSNYAQFAVPDLSGDVTYTFPASTETIASLEGATTQVIYNSGGTTYAGDAGFVFNSTTDTITLGEDGVDGKVILYNDGGTDYNLTLQPGTQSGAAVITFPGASGTLATLGNAETFTGIKTISANWVNTANPWAVNEGGTGAATLADGGLVIGNGTGAVEVVTAGATTEVLVGGGASTAPVWTTATGSGAPVRATSPTLVTPNIGAATGTSLAVTGAITGLVARGADIATTPVNHNTTDLHGKAYVFTVAATVNLDAAADVGFGGVGCYRIRDAAEAAIIDVDAAEKINLNGTALAAGVGITATGAGEYVCLMSTTDTDGSGTDGWETWGITSGWASQ